MQRHSNTSPVVLLAEQLYNDCPTVKPGWEQLQAYGACQQVWMERAEKLMTLDFDALVASLPNE